jgi:hypothetical protein
VELNGEKKNNFLLEKSSDTRLEKKDGRLRVWR